MRIAVVDDIKEERTLLHGWLYSQLSRRNVSAERASFYCFISGYLYEWSKWN